MGNDSLYLVVLPLVHITNNPVMGYGLTEEVLTLLADRNLATAFPEEGVDTYITAFQWRAQKYLTNDRIKSYEFFKEPAEGGGVLVRVVQNVK